MSSSSSESSEYSSSESSSASEYSSSESCSSCSSASGSASSSASSDSEMESFVTKYKRPVKKLAKPAPQDKPAPRKTKKPVFERQNAIPEEPQDTEKAQESASAPVAKVQKSAAEPQAGRDRPAEPQESATEKKTTKSFDLKKLQEIAKKNKIKLSYYDESAKKNKRKSKTYLLQELIKMNIDVF